MIGNGNSDCEGLAQTLAKPSQPSQGAKRRKLSVEQALSWAVRDEWPKAEAAARMIGQGAPNGYVTGGGFAQMMALGQRVDNHRINGFGVVPFEIDLGAVHGDALLLADAVRELDGHLGAGLAQGFADWEPFADLAHMAGDAEVAALLDASRASARAMARAHCALTGAINRLVVKAAILGLGGWEMGEPEVGYVRPVHGGKPLWFRKVERPCAWNADGEAIAWDVVEADGYDAKRQRPYPDAYRKRRLDPDPALVALARAEWQVWRAALDCLFEMAKGALATIDLTPSRLAWEPWACEHGAGPRVLSGGEALPAEVAPERPRAGRPLVMMAMDEARARYARERAGRARRSLGA